MPALDVLPGVLELERGLQTGLVARQLGIASVDFVPARRVRSRFADGRLRARCGAARGVGPGQWAVLQLPTDSTRTLPMFRERILRWRAVYERRALAEPIRRVAFCLETASRAKAAAAQAQRQRTSTRAVSRLASAAAGRTASSSASRACTGRRARCRRGASCNHAQKRRPPLLARTAATSATLDEQTKQ